MGPCGRPASAPSWQFMWLIRCSLSRFWGRRASTPCALTFPLGRTTGSSEDTTMDSWHREYFLFSLVGKPESQDRVRLNVNLNDGKTYNITEWCKKVTKNWRQRQSNKDKTQWSSKTVKQNLQDFKLFTLWLFYKSFFFLIMNEIMWTNPL